MMISIVFDIHYNYIIFCIVSMAYGFALGMYQTSSNAVMYSVIDKSKLDTVNTLKSSGNMISSSFALTMFTLMYDLYHIYAVDHHWKKIFEHAYFSVVITTAVVQVIMIIWIFFRMNNIKEKS